MKRKQDYAVEILITAEERSDLISEIEDAFVSMDRLSARGMYSSQRMSKQSPELSKLFSILRKKV